jgi:uncharacterized protein (TIGR03437 family)
MLKINRQAVLTLALFGLSAAAFADVSGTPTLASLSALDLDTGKTGLLLSGATGDLLWTGSTLSTYATGVSMLVYTGGTPFASMTQATLAALTYPSTPTPFTSSQLTLNTILAVKTKSGNYSKIQITAPGSSLGINFTTFTGGSAGAPSITSVQNNYGQIPQGLPNSALAPGSLFFIKGSGLSSVDDGQTLRSSAAPGLQTQASNVSVSVTVNGTTVACPLYYLSPGQIDAVLPGNTPVGTGTLTVTNNQVPSAPVAITVAQSAFGIIGYNTTLAATYDAGNAIITSFNAANPGQTIVIWGSGVGADTANDDKLYPQKQDNLTNIPMQVYVGNVPATILYRGRSQFPGVDQIVVTLPSNVPTGCYVSLAVVSGSPSVVSNVLTIPVAASGKTCSDPDSALSPTVLQGLLGKSTVRFGFLTVGQNTNIGAGTNQVSNTVGGFFETFSNFSTNSTGNLVSTGSCYVVTSVGTSPVTPSVGPLDAGPSITVAGPQSSLTLTPLGIPGQQIGTFYGASNTPANFIPASGGNFVFDNGGGGKDVGHFNTTIVAPANFAWTNSATVTAITRSSGATVTWSGGAPGVTVTISGSSSNTSGGKIVVATFTCQAPRSAGQFTIPVPVLLALPSGSGTLSISDTTGAAAGQVATFSATGLDLGLLSGSVSFSENVTYN